MSGRELDSGRAANPIGKEISQQVLYPSQFRLNQHKFAGRVSDKREDTRFAE